jgi:hypothetical protein
VENNLRIRVIKYIHGRFPRELNLQERGHL